MSYRRAKKTSPFIKRVLSTLIFTALVVLLFVATPLSMIFSKAMHGVGVPLWTAGNNFSERSSLILDVSKSSKKDMAIENARLRNTVDEIKGRLLDLSRIQQENANLRLMLRVPNRTTESITARVLSSYSQSIYDGLIIDAGAIDGVQVGQKITVFETVVLGEIVEVFPRTSKIQLYTASSVETDVFLPAYDLIVIATGHGAGNFRIELPRDVEIEEGSQMIEISTNRIVGTLQAALFDPREPFQTVLARSPINTQHLQWVQVINN